MAVLGQRNDVTDPSSALGYALSCRSFVPAKYLYGTLAFVGVRSQNKKIL